MARTRLACRRNVPAHLLMCRNHWFQVSKPNRDLVYATLASGGPLSPDYKEAVDAAVLDVLGRNPE